MHRIVIVVAALAGVSAVQAAPFEPGQWETTATVQSVDMPGAPPQMTKMMIGKSTRSSYCLSAEEAAKRPEELLKQGTPCRVVSSSVSGGALSAEMSCQQNGMTMNSTTRGSYTPTFFSATATAQMTGQMSMRITTSVTGRRTGSCGK